MFHMYRYRILYWSTSEILIFFFCYEYFLSRTTFIDETYTYILNISYFPVVDGFFIKDIHGFCLLF